MFLAFWDRLIDESSSVDRDETLKTSKIHISLLW